MAANKARCVFCTLSAMRKLRTLSTKRNPSVWRKFSSSALWSTNTPEGGRNAPALSSWLRSEGLHGDTDNLKDLKWSELAKLDDKALERRVGYDPATQQRMLGELAPLKSTGSSSPSTSTTPAYTSLPHLTQPYTIATSTAPPAKPRHWNNGWVIPPIFAPTETFMAIPPLPKGRRRRPKRTSPLPFHQIPRTLTHHPQEKSPYGVGNRYRGIFLNHLAPGTTHADVTAGIAATAPVGPITSVTLLRPQPDQQRTFGQLRAHVVFGRHQATSKLVRAARDGVFRVRGAAVPVAVSVDRSVAYHWNNARRIDSRVLLVRGKPDTPGFTEEALRAAMEADEESMKAAGPLGTRSEPVVSYEVDEGCVTIEWRFFSHAQAMAMRAAVERAYGGRLEVYKGWDPCWVDEEKGQVPEKLNREQAWRNDWG